MIERNVEGRREGTKARKIEDRRKEKRKEEK
jgi:hypothetical protein